jgi:hypothetical protein
MHHSCGHQPSPPSASPLGPSAPARARAPVSSSILAALLCSALLYSTQRGNAVTKLSRASLFLSLSVCVCVCVCIVRSLLHSWRSWRRARLRSRRRFRECRGRLRPSSLPSYQGSSLALWCVQCCEIIKQTAVLGVTISFRLNVDYLSRQAWDETEISDKKRGLVVLSQRESFQSGQSSPPP